MTSISSELITGDGRLMTVGDAAQLYRNGVNSLVPTEGSIQHRGGLAYSLTCHFSTLNCDTLEMLNNFKIYSVTTKTNNNNTNCIESVQCISNAHDVAEIAVATSDNGRFIAKLKSPSGAKEAGMTDGAQKQLLEIWDRARLLKTIDVSELDTHGPIIARGPFGNLVWSKTGEQDKLLYVCHPRRPKHLSFFKDPVGQKENESSDEDQKQQAPSKKSSTDVERGLEFVKREDWGECLDGIEHTIVSVLDVADKFQVTTLNIEGYSQSQPQWLDGDTKIVSVAYAEEPRRLGLIYCNNRKSKVTIHDWRSKAVTLELDSEINCYHNLRVDHSGQKFIYMSNPIYGAHKHSVSLNIYDIGTKANKILMDGKFIDNLLINCFSQDDRNILFVEQGQLNTTMCLFNIEEAKLSKVKFPTASVSLLDFRHNIILASGSEVNATPTLFVAAINPQNIDDVIGWHQIEDCVHLDEVEYETHLIPAADDPSISLSAISTKPNLAALRENFGDGSDETDLIKSTDQLPTVVVVHGGPNSAFHVGYNPTLVLYTRLGLKTLLINYRGSLGVSEEYVRSLYGNYGKPDVGDCVHVIRHFVKAGTIDPRKLIIQGGSHGGFLAAHLTCQEEFRLTSAIISNPVIDLYFSLLTTDIPDWVVTGCFDHGGFDFTYMPTNSELIKMYERSPLSKYKLANVPTLMLLGTKDQRVKMLQGQHWANLLKARGVETQCKIYQDKHGWTRAESIADSVMSAVVWILGHLPKRSSR